jgi:signal peptidase I
MPKLVTIFREYRSFLLFLALIMVFRTGYADWSPVPTSSMEPTIYPGDVVWVDKTAYGPSLPFVNKRVFTWAHPERGDIVTLIPPHADVLYVKRVIGLPGDTLHSEGNTITVPAGKLFVMGDFRNNSEDSRYWGFADESSVMGKVTAIALSIADERSGLGRVAVAIR